jgi:hypothetical protein
MERRHFLKLAFGLAAGAAALAASAQAAPLMPQPLTGGGPLPNSPDAHSAVTRRDEIERLQPEEVRWVRHWGHHRHWGWRRRHWGWRRRHWGWHRRRWHRRWHRRYW